MILSRIRSNEAFLSLTHEELVTINNALNEVCNALDVWEFSTRMGVDPEQVRVLLQQVRDVLKRMESHQQIPAG